MEHENKNSFINGAKHQGTESHMDKKKHNYKLVSDPFIHRGQQKVYRFNGLVPGETKVVDVKDPRPRYQRIWCRRQPADLPLPKFKYDQYFVAVVPPKEVTFKNLNDNINNDFLENMCKGFGKIEESKIYYHPKTKKHLGIGKVLFVSSKAAKSCVEKLNQTSKMGNIMTVMLDTMGKERQVIIETLIGERRIGDGDKRKTEAYDPGDSEFEFGHRKPKVIDYPTPQSDMSFSGQSTDLGYSTGTVTPAVQSSSEYNVNAGGLGHGFAHPSGNHGNHQPTPPTIIPNYNNYHSETYTHQYPKEDYQYPKEDYHYSKEEYPESQYSNNSNQSYDNRHKSDHERESDHDRDRHDRYGRYRKDSDHGRDRYDRNDRQRGDREWDKRRHRDRDNRSYRDNDKYERDNDRDFDRNSRDNDRFGRDVKYRKDRDRGSKHHRDKKPEPPPPPRPKTPEEEEPRFLSLESRIQSLLSTGVPDEPSAKQPVEPPEPPVQDNNSSNWSHSKKNSSDSDRHSSKYSSGHDRYGQNEWSHNSSSNNHNSWDSGHRDRGRDKKSHHSYLKNSKRHSESPKQSHSTTPLQDENSRGSMESDRMSLVSGSSGENKMPLHPVQNQQTPFIPPTPVGFTPQTPAYGQMTPASFSQIPPSPFMPSTPAPFSQMSAPSPFIPQTPSSFPATPDAYNQTSFNPAASSSFNESSSFNQDRSSGTGLWPPGYNMNFIDSMNFNQNYMTQYEESLRNGNIVSAEDQQAINDKMFMSTLDTFVKDLKQVLQKDLCKKMVVSSAFKTFEKWWDEEEAHRKAMKALPSLMDMKTSDKGPKPTTTTDTGVSSTLASLFEPRHPWGRDGGLEAGLGFGRGFGMGGLLGIRGGMPKLPSFKKKVRPPSPPPVEDEDSKASLPATKEQETEESGDRKSRIKRPVVSESEDDSDDEKAKSSDEEESSDESSDEESEEESSEAESDADSDAESDDDEEVETESRAKSKVDSSDKEDEVDVEKVDEEEEESSAASSSSSSESEDEDSKDEKSETEEAEADEKKPLSPIVEEKEQEEEKMEVNEKDKEEVEEKMEEEKLQLPKKTEKDDESMDVDISTVSEDESSATDTTSPQKQVQETKNLSATTTSSSSASASSSTESSSSPVKSSTPQPQKVPKKRGPKPKTPAKAKEAPPPLLSPPPPVKAALPEVTLSDIEKKPYINPAIAEHDYFAAPPVVVQSGMESDATESADEESSGMSREIWMDHSYCLPSAKYEYEATKSEEIPVDSDSSAWATSFSAKTDISESDLSDNKKKPKKPPAPRRKKAEKLKDITNKPKGGSRELASILPPPTPKPKPVYRPRSYQEERQIFFEIFSRGVDEEDIRLMKRTYDDLMQSDDPMFYWLSSIFWVDHPHTNIPDPTPPKKKRKIDEQTLPPSHKTGCSRTEGYYKLTDEEKEPYLWNARNISKVPVNKTKTKETTKKNVSQRDARSENRRLQSAFAAITEMGDLLKFNQLKCRKKQLRFAKSPIHDWGLFALEPIAADEMVIEYVGQNIRHSLAELREKKYETDGIGSSYLFRVDHDTIIDATKVGNLARFVNHCCSPNCYAKIITMDSHKKIVIYSKRDIDINEEITYDYKFPLEDEKIPCLCGAQGCRGTLN